MIIYWKRIQFEACAILIQIRICIYLKNVESSRKLYRNLQLNLITSNYGRGYVL